MGAGCNPTPGLSSGAAEAEASHLQRAQNLLQQPCLIQQLQKTPLPAHFMGKNHLSSPQLGNAHQGDNSLGITSTPGVQISHAHHLSHVMQKAIRRNMHQAVHQAGLLHG